MSAVRLHWTRIFSGAHDGSVCAWDTVTGARLASVPAHAQPVSGIMVRDSYLVSAGWDGAVQLWRVHT